MASNQGVGHIVAMGGGGFSMEPANPLLDDFVLSLSRRQPAKVCFVPTASADSATYLVSFYRAFSGRCIPSDLTLFDSPLLTRRPGRSSELAAFVAEQDVIYVGGGSTANLLAVWRAHGLDVVLREAWADGIILSGVRPIESREKAWSSVDFWSRALRDRAGDLRPCVFPARR
jgi:dipeptidase E